MAAGFFGIATAALVLAPPSPLDGKGPQFLTVEINSSVGQMLKLGDNVYFNKLKLGDAGTLVAPDTSGAALAVKTMKVNVKYMDYSLYPANTAAFDRFVLGAASPQPAGLKSLLLGNAVFGTAGGKTMPAKSAHSAIGVT